MTSTLVKFCFFSALAFWSLADVRGEKKKENADAGSSADSTRTAGNRQLPEPTTDSVTVADLEIFFQSHPLLKNEKEETQKLYLEFSAPRIWSRNAQSDKQARALFDHAANLKAEGLSGTLIYGDEFSKIVLHYDSGKRRTAAEDIMLSVQFIHLAHAAWTGISENKGKALKWNLPGNQPAYVQWITSLQAGKELFESPPVYRQYQLLKNCLARYQSGIYQSFPDLRTVAGILKSGDSSAVVDSIRKWLFISGDLILYSAKNVFDDSLARAIKHFQRRMGIKEDGSLGPATLSAMNVPANIRIRQICVNMERSRWIPVTDYKNYFVINVPEYKLHAYENDSLIWSMNVVVGKPTHRTAVFSGTISTVVFSPYWNVPPGIMNNEIIPGISKTKSYLADHDMEWNDGQVRQKPGPDNALGLVKFLFPNSYDIYLHDTPEKSLFGETNRDFSHGCIRLEDAEKVANFLLRTDTTWTKIKIDAAMHSGKERAVALKKKEAVFIAYFSAWVDREGSMNFRKDIYGLDGAVSELLAGKDENDTSDPAGKR